MPLFVIHVYHESADYLVDLVRRRAPQRGVIGVSTPDALAEIVGEIEVLFAPTPPREGWANAARLRLIQLLGVGADTLLPSPDLPAHIEVAGVRGVFAPDVAEHVLALMLAHVRRLPLLAEQQRVHQWEPAPRPTLAGQRLTIVGYGAVGQHLARVARALGMQVRAVSRTGSQSNRDADIEVAAVSSLVDAVADAAFIVIAAPLTPQTRGLFDDSLLDSLRADAFLVNVARGGIVDECALARALSAGRLAGAAFDVFESEPLPADSPLWTVPRLVITPHIAGLGDRYIERCVDALLANVAALEAGRPRQGVVDRDVGY